MGIKVIRDRFIVTDFQKSCDADGIVFTCKTDNDCRLKLQLFFGPPIFKTWKHAKRGIVQVHDRYFNPNVFLTQWQDEPGDTYWHTFHLSPIIWDQLYYFYFKAWRLGAELFSISQIFTHQCSKPEFTEMTCPLAHRACWCYGAGFNWPDAYNGWVEACSAANVPWISHHKNWEVWYACRSALYFDCWALPVGISIVSAKIRIQQEKADRTSAQYHDAVAGTFCFVNAPDTEWPCVVGNFGYLKNCTAIVASKWFPAETTPWGWQEYELNAAGRANITPGGIAIFGMRIAAEIANQDPGDTNCWFNVKADNEVPYEAWLDIKYTSA